MRRTATGCPLTRFDTLAAAEQELLTRRSRAVCNGAPPAVDRYAYECDRCHGAHIDRHRADDRAAA